MQVHKLDRNKYLLKAAIFTGGHIDGGTDLGKANYDKRWIYSQWQDYLKRLLSTAVIKRLGKD